jgi:MFS family permease
MAGVTTGDVSTTVTGAVPGMEIKEGGLGSRAQSAALATLCLVLFLTFLDNTVVSVGLADVQSGLHAGITSLQWVVNGYALTFAAFMLAGGTLGDMLGRKKVMLAGVAVFCAGSVVAATGSQRRRPDRRPRSSWASARPPRSPGHSPSSATSTRTVGPGPTPSGSGRPSPASPWPSVPSSAACWSGCGAGAPSSGSTCSSAPWPSSWRCSSCPRRRIAGGADRLDRHRPRRARTGHLSFGIIQGEQSGYLTWWIDLCFAAAVVLGALFAFAEHKVRVPVLDFSLFRKAPFSGSVFVAFAAYFGTFSIFFFTALYIDVVVNASAYQTAVTFLPMAAGLIVASIVTGPWVARQGPRVPMTIGCVLAAVGIGVSSHLIGPHVYLPTLGWALTIAGVGFGIMLVPVTSTPLTVVRPEHSGMAASVTNTSREMGAVFGVAVLGSIVNSKLTGQLAARLKAIGIPPQIQSMVIHAVTGGGLSGGAASSAEHSKEAAAPKSPPRW